MRDPGTLIKADKWWNDKAPSMLGLAYYLLAVHEHIVPVSRYLPATLAFVAAFIGVAGFGHVINDLEDIKSDRIAGKRNAMDGRSTLQTVLIAAALLFLAWIPWVILPADRLNLSLVALQLILLTLYAVPPARLKVRAVPGVIADALYGYTVPTLITWTTWSRVGGSMGSHTFLLLILIPWSFCAGLRGILNHQLRDIGNDVSSGVSTFGTTFGSVRTLWLLSRLVLPLEITCFVLMTATIARDFWFYPVGVGLFLWWRYFEITCLQNKPEPNPLVSAAEHYIELYGYEFLGEFYGLWFPVLMLFALLCHSFHYLPLALAHFLVFKTGILQLLRYDPKYVGAQITRMRRQHV